MTLGVISDTHGLLRAEALQAFRGVSRILHAGDVGDPTLLRRLGAVAPVTAVRGNVDLEAWAGALPLTAEIEAGGVWIHMRHILEELDLSPAAAGFRVVIHGHSHRPALDRRGGVLYLNPGSAGPRRFRLPATVALLEVDGQDVHARHVSLPDR